MDVDIFIKATYVPSEDIVAREIEGELIIVPLTAGIGDMEDELYTLNETGRAIWDLLDGKNSLKNIVKKLSTKFEAPAEEIETDVIGLVKELFIRRIVVETSDG
ncbi:PqqD family protein [Thermodesulfobacteriota bacterium]